MSQGQSSQGRPSQRPSDKQLAYLERAVGRRQIGKMLGASHRTVDRWCQEAAAASPELFDVDEHPTAAAAIEAIETHHRSLAERVPELVDAMVTKMLKILESEILDARTANDQLQILIDCLTSGRLVPLPTADAATGITDTTRADLLARVQAATASAVAASRGETN